MQKFTETSIPQNYSSGLFNTHGYDIAPELAPKMADVIFEGTSTCLGLAKKKNVPWSVIFNDFNQEFLCGAVIEYEENEDPTQPGSWNYFWTWNEEDIPENANRTTITDGTNASHYRGVSQGKYAFGFKSIEGLATCLTYLLKTIYNWLNDNASDKDEVGVELEGVFQARVAIENGEKVMSIEPDGEMKKLIKDDLALEVK